MVLVCVDKGKLLYVGQSSISHILKFWGIGIDTAITNIKNRKSHARLKYWNLMVRRDACIRRGLDEDAIMAEDVANMLDFYANPRIWAAEERVRSSLAYRIGSAILYPVRVIKSLLKK